MLVASGARVVVADLKGEAPEGGRFVETDVTDEVSVRAAVNAALEVGGLRGAVNCAGVASAEKVLGREGPHSLDSFAKVVQVNLIGTFNVIRLAAEAMVSSDPSASGERGVIVNTASVAAFEGQIGQVAYAASKGGVAALTIPLARDLAHYGIRVMTIAPGTFDTPMLAGLSDVVRQRLAAEVPFPSRLGNPAEYAALVGHI